MFLPSSSFFFFFWVLFYCLIAKRTNEFLFLFFIFMQYISLNKNYGLIFYMLHPLIQEVFFLIKKKKKGICSL